MPNTHSVLHSSLLTSLPNFANSFLCRGSFKGSPHLGMVFATPHSCKEYSPRKQCVVSSNPTFSLCKKMMHCIVLLCLSVVLLLCCLIFLSITSYNWVIMYQCRGDRDWCVVIGIAVFVIAPLGGMLLVYKHDTRGRVAPEGKCL